MSDKRRNIPERSSDSSCSDRSRSPPRKEKREKREKRNARRSDSKSKSKSPKKHDKRRPRSKSRSASKSKSKSPNKKWGKKDRRSKSRSASKSKSKSPKKDKREKRSWSRSKSKSPTKKGKTERSKSRSRSCSNSSKSSCSSKSSRSSKSKSRSRSPKRERSRSRSCSPNRFEWCDVYQYFKNRLVCDNDLMVAGSSAYTNLTNTTNDIIPTNHLVVYNNPVVNYNIDHFVFGSPFFVREDGIYILFFVINVDTAAQFTIFVNGVMMPLTCTGTNAGAGQLLVRSMLPLKKNDQVIIRNYITSSNSLYAICGAGGTQQGNSSSCLLMKIEPLNPAEPKEGQELCHKKKHLFKKVKEALMCDKELMVKGFDVAGTFTTTVGQLVPLEGDINFAQQNHVTDLTWNIANPSQVIIKESGVYKLFFLLTSQTAIQFAMTVNGVAVESTTEGSNKGAGQLSSRAILTLKKGDIVTVRNHSSQNGAVQLTDHAGGANATISAVLTIFKVAPVCKPVYKDVPKCVAEELECWYEPLKNYLLCKEYLQIAGCKAHVSIANSFIQTLLPNEPFRWSTPVLKSHHIKYIPGDTFITIEKSGLYDVFADIATNEPLQIALFVNNVAVPITNFGRDSGSNRCVMRQFVALKRGDVISINNYLSTSASVTTVENAGGNNVGNNALFMAFFLHPIC